MSFLWNLIGLLSFALGFLGLFLPLLPTTPLWLLAAFCLLKGSHRLYNRIMKIQIFNEVVTNFQKHRAIPLHIKVWVIFVLWTTMMVSVYMVRIWWIAIILLVIAVAVTIHILSYKTLRK